MKAVIVAPYTDLEEVFASEDKELSNGRASYSINTTDTSTMFNIIADDAVALRAMLNGITKTLSVYEKAEELIEDDSE